MDDAAVGDEPNPDLSAASTVVYFDTPIPLLRGPVPASPADDPAGTGPFLLAFPDAATWRAAYRRSESKMLAQCEAGARVGCAVSASNKCKPPWWKNIFEATSATDFEERNKCEEQEMASCLAASKEACIKFAKEKCLSPFRDARIALPGLVISCQLIMLSADDEDIALSAGPSKSDSASADGMNVLCGVKSDATTYRGSVLFKKVPVQDETSFAGTAY